MKENIDVTINDFGSVIDIELKNFNSSIKIFKSQFDFSNKLLILFKDIPQNLIKAYPRECVPIIQMHWLCFRKYVISQRLLFEAHISEAFSLTSSASEAVAYAKLMHNDKSKINVWLMRDKENPRDFRKKMGDIFPKSDPDLFPNIYNIYNITSEYGRHSNFSSTIFFTDLSNLSNGNKVEFKFCDFENLEFLKTALDYNVFAFLKILKVYKNIFIDFVSEDWKNEFDEFENDYQEYLKTRAKSFDKPLL